MLEKLSVPIAIVIAGVLIGGSLYLSNVKIASQPQVKNVELATSSDTDNMRPISADDHILGNPNATLKIVEYSDLECPFCKVFHSTLKQVMDVYGKNGKVAWVYRHFPIDQLHSKARKEAEATECANELGGPQKFWEFTDMIYTTTNSNNSLDLAELPKIAKKIGLDVTAFNTCLSSGRYAAKVEADYQDAVKAGGRGTPNSIVVSADGTKTVIQGAQSYEAVKAIIDALLK
ncbi:MAG: Periplasmic thiol:disulfide interchange protein DsbA [Parcubacteria bacterium C7867-006]|nr:MAG: Periplasmic thiol:disulfide interchange protein DsbA [Parcubacteria bacterium C7867-006]